MKKWSGLAFVLLVTMLLSGCVMFIPSTDSIGESKSFEKNGITLLLTDKFEEKESKEGFDAYFVSDFAGVMVMKEPFSLAEELEDRELSEYIENVMENNGHTDIEPQNEDGLWYYINDKNRAMVYYSYCYKGSDAFWNVQFACYKADESALKDLFYLWAQAVEVE